MSISKSSRRDFCIHACQAASLITIGSLIEGCGGSPTAPSNVPQLPTINASASGGTITVAIDAASPLAAAGGAALVQSGAGNFLVSRNAQDTFTALTSICTHQQCTVSGFQNQLYVCPCHGSEYSLTGSVVQGPAAIALRQFATRFANNVLTITVA